MFVKTSVPETNGQSLEALEAKLGANDAARRSITASSSHSDLTLLSPRPGRLREVPPSPIGRFAVDADEAAAAIAAGVL